jgi:hypothetical protein
MCGIFRNATLHEDVSLFVPRLCLPTVVQPLARQLVIPVRSAWAWVFPFRRVPTRSRSLPSRFDVAWVHWRLFDSICRRLSRFAYIFRLVPYLRDRSLRLRQVLVARP